MKYYIVICVYFCLMSGSILDQPKHTVATSLVSKQENLYNWHILTNEEDNKGTLLKIVPNLKNNEIGAIYKTGPDDDLNYYFIKLQKTESDKYYIYDIDNKAYKCELGSDLKELIYYYDFVIYTKQEENIFYVYNVFTENGDAKEALCKKFTLSDTGENKYKFISFNANNNDNIYFKTFKGEEYSMYSTNIYSIISTYINNSGNEVEFSFGNLIKHEDITITENINIFNPIIENSYYYTEGDNIFYKSDDDTFSYDTEGGSNLFAYNNVGLYYKSDENGNKIYIVDLTDESNRSIQEFQKETTLTSLIINNDLIAYCHEAGNMFSPLPYSLTETTSFIPLIDTTIDNNKVIHSIDENLAYLKEDIVDKGISVDMRDTNKEIEKLGFLTGDTGVRASITTLNNSIQELITLMKTLFSYKEHPGDENNINAIQLLQVIARNGLINDQLN